jgi:hypothetical protein
MLSEVYKFLTFIYNMLSPQAEVLIHFKIKIYAFFSYKK